MKILIDALRKGASLPNKTGWKWASIATVAALIALKVSQSFGVLEEVHDETVIEIVGLLITLYLSVATTDRLGVLPERVPDEPVPAKPDAPGIHPDGFPKGPFHDS